MYMQITEGKTVDLPALSSEAAAALAEKLNNKQTKKRSTQISCNHLFVLETISTILCSTHA